MPRAKVLSCTRTWLITLWWFVTLGWNAQGLQTFRWNCWLKGPGVHAELPGTGCRALEAETMA